MQNKRKKVNTRRFAIKLLLSSIYLVIITILLVGSYQIFKKKQLTVHMDEASSVKEYSYIEISKMSEKFAYFENENIGLHFVIEEKETGEWHTYVIAINENDYNKYKELIDYSYERTKEVPNKVQVYGYPNIMNDDLKEMILHNISNFIPADSNITITKDNLEQYLTNSFLNTTEEKKETFNILLFSSLLLMFIMFALLIFTIFDKDRIVDSIEEKVDKLERKAKRR